MARTYRLCFLALVFAPQPRVSADGPKATATEEKKAAADEDQELRKLLEEKYAAAKQGFKYYLALYEAGRAPTMATLDAVKRVRDAGLELEDAPDKRIALLKEILRDAETIEEYIARRVKSGIGLAGEMSEARYFRLDVQIQLLKEQRKLKAAKGK